MWRWLDERLELGRLQKKFLRKAFPVHHSFFLGEIAMFAFITLIITGVFLSLNFEPSSRTVTVHGRELPAAYASVQRIDGLPFGAVIRSVHHWSAHAMIVAAFLHLLRVLLSGAYKKPREVNWFVGLGLLGLAIVTAFTGYALPFDAYAVTATKIGYGIAASIPWLGGWIAQAMFGGEFPTELSISRLTTLHTVWLPLLVMALVGLHLLVMIKQKHTQPRYARAVAPGKTLGVPMLPHQGLMMGILFLLYLGVVFFIGGAFIAHPLEAFGPPSAATPNVKPDWYFLWIYGILKIVSFPKIHLLGTTINSEFVGGVVVPGLLGVVAVLLPFLDVIPHRQRYLELPTEHPIRTGVTVGLIAFFVVATLAGYKDELGLSADLLWALLIGVPIFAALGFSALIRAFVRLTSNEADRLGDKSLTRGGGD
jgi:cytochrome b-561